MVVVISKYLFLLGGAALFIAFIIYSPILDQHLAVMPYDFSTHKFYGEVVLWCRFIYRLVPVLTTLIIISSFLCLYFRRRFANPNLVKKTAVITLFVLAIGPGLFVNVIFKDHWGRARPYQVIRDHKTFTPFWQPRPNHPENNSFCGGHASIGFFLGVPLLAMGRRKLGALVSLGGGVLVGAVRMLQGGHYLSDVIFAGVCVWIVTLLTLYAYNAWFERNI